MKACSDLEFLDQYWKEAKKVAEKIKNELPNFKEPDIKSKNGSLMYIVNFSDLKNSWSPKDILADLYGSSVTLKILASKIDFMIMKGRADSIKPMIKSIIEGKIRHFSKGLSKEQIKTNFDKSSTNIRERLNGTNYTKQPLGRGHFRWDNGVHTLTQAEINHLRKYFKL